jgi:hypothetical protein
MSEAVLLAPLMVALALGAGGAAKLGSRPDLARAFDDLGVPAALATPGVMTALPWVELALAACLLLVPAPVSVVVALVAVVLTGSYLVLVARVVGDARDVSCDCFGGFSSGRVGWLTVSRNLVLVAASVLYLGDALGGHSFVQRLLDLDREGVGWLVGALALALLVGLVLWRSPGGAALPVEGEHQRRGIPFLDVELSDGTVVTLPALASRRAQLVVSLSTTCSRCARVSDVIADWPALVPEIDVRVLTATPPDEPVPREWPEGVLHDPGDRVATVIGLARPSAVLLGADALIAGGPVHGPTSVLEFFAEVRERLEEARQSAD